MKALETEGYNRAQQATFPTHALLGRSLPSEQKNHHVLYKCQITESPCVIQLLDVVPGKVRQYCLSSCMLTVKNLISMQKTLYTNSFVAHTESEFARQGLTN